MIVVAGEALIDLVVEPDGGVTAVPGGGPFNTARAIGRLGGEVAFLGVLSTDRFGGRLRDALATDGVDLSMTMTTDAPTTLAVAERGDRGGATYRFHTAGTSALELTADDVEVALLTRPQAFHLGSLGLVLEPMASALAAGMAAVDKRTLVMLDPNCRPALLRDYTAWLDRIEAVFARADVVKLSVDDLDYLEPGAEPSAGARLLLDRGPAVVILTDGPRDVRVLTRDAEFDVPVPPVHVVDTIGAGDTFGGAFLARWIERGFSRVDLGDLTALSDAVTFAIDVAAAIPGRPDPDAREPADPSSMEVPAAVEELYGWLHLLRVLAWARSPEALSMLDLKVRDPDRLRAVSRSILDDPDGLEAERFWDDPEGRTSEIETKLEGAASPTDLRSVVRQMFARSRDEEHNASDWARFFRSVAQYPPTAVSPEHQTVLEIGMAGLGVARWDDLPEDPVGGGLDDWDFGFDMDHGDQEPTTLTLVARQLLDYDELWPRVDRILADEEARRRFLTWARAEADARQLEFMDLKLPPLEGHENR